MISLLVATSAARTVQTDALTISVTVARGWTDPSTLITLVVGVLSVGVAFLLWLAYCRTNRLQRDLVELTRKQHDWQIEMKNPKLLYRNATLKKIASSRAFVIGLEFLNPGEIPIQIETAISSLDKFDPVKEDFTRKRQEFRTAEPRTPYRTDLTITTSRAQEPEYWPSTVRVTLKYVSARTKLFTFSFDVHPRGTSDAFLMISGIEESLGDATGQ